MHVTDCTPERVVVGLKTPVVLSLLYYSAGVYELVMVFCNQRKGHVVMVVILWDYKKSWKICSMIQINRNI